MLRLVNCLNPIHTRYAAQVHLIGAKPIVQVRRQNKQIEPLAKKLSFFVVFLGKGFFFPRLPIGQYGPVSQLSRSEERCTGPFNWGEAHCAGEKVKRKIGPFLRKSLKNQTRTRTQQKGAQPATATRNPLARLPGARAKEETNPTNKRLHQQILVRLNVLDLQWTIL